MDSLKIRIRESIFLSNLSEDLLCQVKADNVFSNPSYISNEEQGRSNWKTEPTITTYSYENGFLVLPRGYMSQLLTLCKKHGIDPEIIDERSVVECAFPEELAGIKLRPHQQKAVCASLKYSQGCVVSPTGSGKSLIGLEIIRQKQQRSLILVHRSDLATQWQEVIKERLGIEAGMIGAGEWTIGEEITVALVQSLQSREKDTKALVETFGLILCDEMHHIPAKNIFELLAWFPAKYRYGLSATPRRRDGLEKMIYLGVGPIFIEIDKKEVEELGAIVPASVNVLETHFKPEYCNSWHEYSSQLSVCGKRNELIIDLSKNQTEQVLVLVDRVSHAEQLSEMFSGRGVEHVLVHGQLAKSERTNAMQAMKTAAITVGTTSLLGEGLDVSAWSILILASPISSEIKLRQAIGRVVRSAPGKKKALVYDLKDDCGFAGSSFNKRFEIYKQQNIWVNFPKQTSEHNERGSLRRRAS